MDLIGFLRLICTNGYSFPLGDECQETLTSLVPCKNGTRDGDVLELASINMALETWLELGNICDLAVKSGHIKN